MKNPFPDPVVFERTEPIDLPTLNESTTEDLIKRIDAISALSLAGEIPRSQCVLLLGPAGSGKTHLFQRLRKKRGGRSVFFYTRPEPGAMSTPRYLLAQLVDALRLNVPGSERTQLDLIAAAMLSRTAGHPRGYPLAFLSQTHDNPGELVEQALQAAERQYPELAPKYLERLLLAPFQTDARTRRATYAWLSGRPPSEDELALLREPQGLSDEDIRPALRTLGFAAAFGAPLVIVIDQIENLADDDPARARLIAHTQLISEIYDTVPGMLIVQMAVDSEWTRFIEPSLAPQIAIRVRGTVLPIHPPTPEQSRQIINLHLDQIPPEERLKGSPWPFDEARIARWIDETMTPRALLQRCKSAFDDFLAGKLASGSLPPPPTHDTLDRRLQSLWEGFVDAARGEIDRAARDNRALDAERIASGLLAVLPLRGAVAKRVSGKKNRPDVRVATSPTSLVLVAQHNHHKSLAALLSEAQSPDAGRIVVVREGSFAIPSTWRQVHALLGELQTMPHFAYVTIAREELTDWLACEGMLSAGRSKDLNDEAGRVIDNPVVVAWLERKSAAWRSEVLARIAGLRAGAISKPGPLEDVAKEDPVSAPETARAGARSPVQGGASAPPTPDDASNQYKTPAAPEHFDSPPNTAPDPGISMSREVEELETRILQQLVKLGVRAAVIRRIVGARLIRLELSVPRQRVAALDKAAPDVEHKLADDVVCFEREGPRRFFSARRARPRAVRLDELTRREEAWLRDKPGRFLLGESLDGQTVKGDLADGSTCHLLVAGQSGSGKSVLLSGLVLCLAAHHPPSRVRFTLGDPKRVTFTSIAEQLAGHVAGEVAYDPDTIVDRLEKLAAEMDVRYRLFQQGHVRDIHGHNACAVQKLPLHVVVIDEFADMLADKAFKQSFLDVVKRVGNMGRAAGIHMILATQRPDKNAVPGEIKANLSGKVALRVQSAINSRIVLDAAGAEKLLGKGDFLADLGHGLVRGQAAEL